MATLIIPAKIYRIVSDKGDKVYIGSTKKQYLSTRWAGHKSDHRKKAVKCTVSQLFDEYGMENCRCELIEEVIYNTKEDYLARERYWIENTPNCVNDSKPIWSEEEEKQHKREYQKNHREELKATDPTYMEKKRQQCNSWKERNKEPILCECGMFYSATHKARHLATQRHKDKLNSK